ncbi:MAG TPA: hypothetical protein VD707_09215 [Gemmatimonadales bacterium]|jgi:hypothetical protein|nr:hypothetical protein [Gemmatimonadales bacterium]
MRGAAIGVLVLCGAAAHATAQVAPNRATRYLFQTDVLDGRAVWVNPAGTAVTASASVYGDIVVGAPDDATRFQQLSAGFSSRGLTFGYQYDDFEAGVGHTYRLGLAGGSGPLAIGAAAAYYRGGTSDWGYDVGAVFRPGRGLVLGATAANIGEPVVRGLLQEFAFVPGATLTPFGPSLELSVQGRLASAAESYSVGARWQPPLGFRSALIVRLDTDSDLRGTGFAFGVAIGGQDQAGLVLTTPRDLATVEATSVYGVAARPMGRR